MHIESTLCFSGSLGRQLLQKYWQQYFFSFGFFLKGKKKKNKPRVSRTAPGLLFSPCLEVIKVEWQCVSRELEKVMKIVLARDCQCHIKVSL